MGKYSRFHTQSIAFGGVMAALAVVIMCMGGLIPVATYVCPMLCILILSMVHARFGSRISWAWYAAVCLLSVLLGPDKEASAVFVALGYYPIVKPWFERRPWKLLWKCFYFNGSILALYWILMQLMGLTELKEEIHGFGMIGIIMMLVAGNLIFGLLDRLLSMRFSGRK